MLSTVVATLRDYHCLHRFSAVCIWNMGLRHSLTDALDAYLSIKNIGNVNYIASRRPNGIFSGPERQLVLGLQTLL